MGIWDTVTQERKHAEESLFALQETGTEALAEIMEAL